MPILDEWASGSTLTKPPTGFPDWRIQRGHTMARSELTILVLLTALAFGTLGYFSTHAMTLAKAHANYTE